MRHLTEKSSTDLYFLNVKTAHICTVHMLCIFDGVLLISADLCHCLDKNCHVISLRSEEAGHILFLSVHILVG